MRQRTYAFLFLSALCLVSLVACGPAPPVTPLSTDAASMDSEQTTPTYTIAIPAATSTDTPSPPIGGQSLPTMIPIQGDEEPRVVPTFDRATILPTPMLPAGTDFQQIDFAVLSVENVRQLSLVREIRSEDGINSNLAFSPDGRWLAAGSSTGVIHVWDAATGEEVALLEGHTGRVRTIAFSPGGDLLASGGWDKSIILWDTATWTPIRTLLGHEHYVSQVVFSPDGTLLASGGIPLIIWDVASGEQLYTIDASGLIPEDLEFSPDGSLLASAHGETDFFLWRVADGNLEHTLVGESTTSFLAFSSEGMLAAGSSSFSAGDRNPLGQILFWDPWLGSSIGATQENAAVVDMLFSNDSSLFITCGWAGHDIIFWRTTDGMRIWGLTGHPRTAYTLALSSDGTLLASGDLDGRILLWGVSASLP